MTNFEHFMLTVCFGMSIGWVVGIYIVIITDKIKTTVRKHKEKKTQIQSEDTERTSDQ